MTNRKALIERIQAMQLGTQEMLDAAAEDATLIPFDTLFVSKKYNCVVWRNGDEFDDKYSVGMAGPNQYFCADQLMPLAEN